MPRELASDIRMGYLLAARTTPPESKRAIMIEFKFINMRWDVFISHASEDKLEVARPLADLLGRSGLRVWLDENELKIGDSLRERIDQGLANSEYGIVILSPAFFAKDWPTRELDGLAARETRNRKVILPVWHQMNQALVAQHSPMLADKLAVSTDRGIDQVALAILKVIRPGDGQPDFCHAAERARNLFSDPSSLVGTAFGRYDLLELIGSGGSGIVFRAKQRSSGLQVALKLFYPLADSLASFDTLFERAFRAVASLSHQNIARVFDFGRANFGDSSASYMTMEYIRGQSLDVWSESIADAPDAYRRRMLAAIQLTEALQAAHGAIYTDDLGFEVRGVLHGDLKPANVLVVTNGGHDQIKLFDFLLVDIQRLLDPRVVPAQYTAAKKRELPTTGAFGTPGFMAPEQEKSGLMTVKTDIYGLGITLCCLFDPSSRHCACLAEDKGYPAKLRKLVLAMVDREASRRPNSVKLVLDELKAAYRAACEPSTPWKFLDRVRTWRK